MKHTIDEHVPGFEIGELFLSRTDKRGIIQSGNGVFQRLAGYEWPELIGAPHKLIRHPDMPKSAFSLLWKTIQQGLPFGAYVKNRAKDGRYYWVFAVIAPVEDGFLSVRLKPSTQFFEIIQDLYAKMIEAEASGASIEDCEEMVHQAVRSLGFRDYVAFMGFVLGAELVSRAGELGHAPDPSVDAFENMGQLLVELSEEVSNVQALFEGISSSPKNLNILGSRLSTGREAMQVIAQNYELVSNEILASIHKLSERLHALLNKAFWGRMGYCASILYHEAIEDYRKSERHVGIRGHAEELSRLETALAEFKEAAEKGCAQIQHEVDEFGVLTSRLRKMLSGLVVTRVVCRIEAAGSNDDTSSITEISNRLTHFQDELGTALDRIGKACTGLSQKIPQTGKPVSTAA